MTKPTSRQKDKKKDAANIIKEKLEVVLEAEDKVKTQIRKALLEAMQPITNELESVFSQLFGDILKSVLQILTDFKPKKNEVVKALEDLMLNGDEKKIPEINEKVKNIRKEAIERMNKELDAIVTKKLGDIKDKIKLKELSEAFSPFSKLNKIVENVFNLVLNPEPNLEVVGVMLNHRKKIEKAKDTSQSAELSDLLDQEEADVNWHSWWSNWKYRHEAWTLYYELGRIEELGSIIYPVRESAFEYAQMQKEYLSIFSWKFGDYLWYSSKDVESTQDFTKIVQKSFVSGYEKANAFARERGSRILKSSIQTMVKISLIGKIEAIIMPNIKGSISSLEGSLPSPANQLLDVKNLVSETIDETLTKVVNDLLEKNLFEPFADQFKKLDF